MSDFDRMYNEYFGKDNENERKYSAEEERMFNLVDKLNEDRALNDDTLEEDTLGEPSSKRIVLIEGTKFEESIWHTPEGSVIRMKALEPQMIDMKSLGELGNIMNSFGKKVQELQERTPQELLDEAVANEDYEEAVKLRDIIFNKKGKIKENKERAENLNNKGFPADDDWNF